ncbi:MAG: PQQ-dependent sugar dehydrogenase [Spirochaetales bacterium]|nr:PQQ-dependent sugar dehydrogenase [Spirochaetales bacterium]
MLAAIGIARAQAREIVLERVRSQEETIRVISLVDGLQNPWGMAFLPDGRILISERPGRLHLLEDGTLRAVSGLPVIDVGGQGGLLDVALHPDFEENGWIYLAYSAGRGASRGTRIARARLEDRRLADVEELFRMNNGSAAGVHFGSRMVFLPDRTLLFTIGDRGDRQRAQSLGEHAGKTLRINDDGSIPADNPFAGRPGALPEIYTYGNRNAQGMAVQPGSGLVWQHEHGPRGGDEVNIIEAGSNYGWPAITYGREYSGGEVSPLTAAPGMEQPVVYWVPSIAPSGMSFYSGRAFEGWRDNLFVGALAGQHLRRLVVEGREVVHQEVLFQGQLGRIRDVREGPDGFLYILTDARNGALLRLEPAR